MVRSPACPQVTCSRCPSPGWSHHTLSQKKTAGPRDTASFIPDTNLLERLFLEERRRLKIIPNAFGEKPILKLMFGAMIRAAGRWRPIKITDFERRQMTAVRQELDQEYKAQTGLDQQTSKGATDKNLSSSSRT